MYWLVERVLDIAAITHRSERTVVLENLVIVLFLFHGEELGAALR